MNSQQAYNTSFFFTDTLAHLTPRDDIDLAVKNGQFSTRTCATKEQIESLQEDGYFIEYLNQDSWECDSVAIEVSWYLSQGD